MKYELKHRYFKQLTKVTNNFINIAYTLTLRHQMLQSFHLLESNLSQPILVNEEKVNIQHFPPGLQEVLISYGMKDIITKGDGYIHKQLKLNINSVLVINVDDEDIPSLMTVKLILFSNDIYVCGTRLKLLKFNYHCHSYEVTSTPFWELLKISSLIDLQQLRIIDKNCNQYVIMKWYPFIN